MTSPPPIQRLLGSREGIVRDDLNPLITQQSERIAELERVGAALEPFAYEALLQENHFKAIKVELPDHETVSVCFEMGALRKAAQALADLKGRAPPLSTESG
jgi:hypothetical protein